MRKSLSTFTKALNPSQEDTADLRRGPWTLEEDNILKKYISHHGEGRWNLLAKCSGLKRTGKSCRLRWLNYLKPDIKRGNLTPQEQLLILQLHSKWGNRWSKIAQHLPGRTDNEIKNYWRTRVQKQARLLKAGSNSRSITEAVRNILKQKLLSHDYMDQYPSYNNLLATFSSPLLAAKFTPSFPNISPPESSSTPLTQVTESSSQNNNLNATASPDSSPVPGHVPPIDPLESPIPIPPFPGGPTGYANSIDRGKNNNSNNAVAVAVHGNYDYYHNYDHNKDHVGLEDNYCTVDSGSYDMEEFPMHTMYGTGDLYDMSSSTTGGHIEESEWDYSNLPGGYWNMDDIWHFRESDEFGI